MEEPEENDQQSMAQESRRPSKETAATRASVGASEADDGLASVEDNENPARGVKTGKDYIPEFDGRSAMREYERRVRLFEANTSIHPTFRAGKLIERLTDQAWLATEMLDIKTLKTNDGVDKLLQHLWSELEPLEFLRCFRPWMTSTKVSRGPRDSSLRSMTPSSGVNASGWMKWGPGLPV